MVKGVAVAAPFGFSWEARSEASGDFFGIKEIARMRT